MPTTYQITHNEQTGRWELRRNGQLVADFRSRTVANIGKLIVQDNDNEYKLEQFVKNVVNGLHQAGLWDMPSYDNLTEEELDQITNQLKPAFEEALADGEV